LAVIALGLSMGPAFATHSPTISTGINLSTTGSLTIGGDIARGAGTLKIGNTGAFAITIETDGAADIILDADQGADGTILIQGDATTSDKLQLGSDTTPTLLEKTAAGTLTITAATNTILTGPLQVGGDIARGAGTLKIGNTGTNAITIETDGVADIILDSDQGAVTGTILIQGDATDSDKLQLGSDTTPTSLEKTAAGTLTITADTETTFTGDIDATGGFRIAFSYTIENTIDGANNLLAGGVPGVTSLEMPEAGSIIAGTATVDALDAGETLDCVIATSGGGSLAIPQLANGNLANTVTQAKDTAGDTFNANESLTITCTGAGTLDGTEDVSVVAIVEF